MLTATKVHVYSACYCLNPFNKVTFIIKFEAMSSPQYQIHRLLPTEIQSSHFISFHFILHVPTVMHNLSPRASVAL